MKASLAIVAQAPLVAGKFVSFRLHIGVAGPRSCPLTSCERVVTSSVTTHGLLDDFVGCEIDSVRRTCCVSVPQCEC